MGLFLTCLSIVLHFFTPGEVVPSLAPYRIQVFILGFAAIATVPTMITRPLRAFPQPQTALLLGLWGAIAVSHLSHLWIRSAYESVIYVAPIMTMYALVAVNTYSLTRVRLVVGTLIFCAIVLSVEAILAYHTGYKAALLLLYQEDDPRSLLGNRVRAYGLLQDPNDFAQYLLVCIALIASFWKKHNSIRNLFLLALMGGLLYTVYLTFSRGAMVGIAALVYFALGRKVVPIVRLVMAGATIAGLTLVRFTGGREVAMEGGRIVAWGAGLGAFFTRPIFGIGFNHFGDVHDITAHNSFVLCFTELGLFGYFFWMAAIVVTMISLRAVAKATRLKNDSDEFSGVSLSLQAALGAFLVTAWFLSRTYQPVLFMLIAMAGNLVHLRPEAIPAAAKNMRMWAPRTFVFELASIMLVYLMVRFRTF
jgi:putative inorganic carbon (hco3(-)) transporter